jgi:hypothetical protein
MERLHHRLRFSVTLGNTRQKTNPHPIKLLRARRERPCCRRATQEPDELAALHCPNASRACDRKDSCRLACRTHAIAQDIYPLRRDLALIHLHATVARDISV